MPQVTLKFLCSTDEAIYLSDGRPWVEYEFFPDGGLYLYEGTEHEQGEPQPVTCPDMLKQAQAIAAKREAA